MIQTRHAKEEDLPEILDIYNQGIHDRIATLDTDEKDMPMMEAWFREREETSPVVIAEKQDTIVGWASLLPFSSRYVYRKVATLSVYVTRQERGNGIGKLLLSAIEAAAKDAALHKIVLFSLPSNKQGHRLYASAGYREVGVMKEQGMMDGEYIDIVVMEKII
ncbi:arsinothricin resistance N-acetyltransferase ArsN1 family A [Salicibibacter kimchii]|uniref:N-acetyltransferase n=1 Tax=Salicibibacter kimchii TaxID=2099786 RepID=A0A345C2S4_9BACI|nr:arsinothricin resistance N-acetyltransferase ArsN1 family A [Salicibibacter kimchii]AXF57505.1 N-acetyltransferase [Salicibibacter kimchii]